MPRHIAEESPMPSSAPIGERHIHQHRLPFTCMNDLSPTFYHLCLFPLPIPSIHHLPVITVHILTSIAPRLHILPNSSALYGLQPLGGLKPSLHTMPMSDRVPDCSQYLAKAGPEKTRFQKNITVDPRILSKPMNMTKACEMPLDSGEKRSNRNYQAKWTSDETTHVFPSQRRLCRQRLTSLSARSLAHFYARVPAGKIVCWTAGP